jgi:hypothetical protein
MMGFNEDGKERKTPNEENEIKNNGNATGMILLMSETFFVSSNE